MEGDNFIFSEAYQPINRRIVVRRVVNNMTDAGIFLPDTVAEADKYMEVVAVSKDVNEVKVGDLVLLVPEISAPVFKVGEHEYAQIEIYNIMGIVNPLYRKYFKQPKTPDLRMPAQEVN